MPNEERNSMPAFYHNPVVLNASEHAQLSVVKSRTYAYAKTVNCVPVVLGEIPRLLPHYPVVFTTGDVPMLVALMGLRNDENLFVGEDGSWMHGAYIPAYVRRYPFILIRVAGGDVALGAEVDPSILVPLGDNPLFAAGAPTDMAKDVYHFCREFQTALEETQAFCKEVADAGLLKSKVCTIKRDDGKSIRLTGFSAVEEAELDSLENHTVNAWRKKHLLKYLYFHLASMERITTFAERFDVAPAEKTPA